MAENKFVWHVWDSKCKDHEADDSKLYLRLEAHPKKLGIRMSICDKNGATKRNGNILTIDFQTGVIILLDSFSDKYGLKTDYDKTPLTVKEAAWSAFADSVNESIEIERDESIAGIKIDADTNPELFAKFKSMLDKLTAKQDKDTDNDE